MSTVHIALNANRLSAFFTNVSWMPSWMMLIALNIIIIANPLLRMWMLL